MDATGAGTSLAPKCGAGSRGAGAAGAHGAAGAVGAAPRAVRSESIFLGTRKIEISGELSEHSDGIKMNQGYESPWNSF